MNPEEVRKIVLETLEAYMDVQVKAVQELKGKTVEAFGEGPRRGRRRQSLVDMSYKLLTEAGTPLHVSALVDALREAFSTSPIVAPSPAPWQEGPSGLALQQTARSFATLPDPGRR